MSARRDMRAARDEWVRAERRKDQPLTPSLSVELATLALIAVFVALAPAVHHFIRCIP